MEIKINYLYHSGFAVETKNYFLIFDYFKDTVEKGEKCISNGAVGEEDLKVNKKILVFSSHRHFDHFNPVIFQWKKIRPDIKYVLSKDIRTKMEPLSVYKISAYEELNIEDLQIKAYGSTDIGVSFLVRVDGAVIFHAGDLNWWYWWDDSEKNIERAEKNFKAEIQKIKGEKINIAFFPVDPRLEQNCYKGPEYFINEIQPEAFIPMHFGDNYGEAQKYMEITHRGQEISLIV